MNEIVLLCSLVFLAHAVKGLTGGGSAIVFNACLLVSLMAGLAGALELKDGLYFLAGADLVVTLAMAVLLWRELKFEKLTVLYLAGFLPVQALFTLVLPKLELEWLTLLLALAVTGAGLWLALRDEKPPAPRGAMLKLALPLGAVAGTIGGLFGMAGPVTFLLFTMADSDPGVIRRRVVFFTIAANTSRTAVLASEGVFTTTRLTWVAWALPFMLTGMALGMWLHRRVKPRPFRVTLGVLVALAGLAALAHFVVKHWL
ncbi:MAG: TSUP family transporter [Planctomycetes bacterium]|nr:TSUP family transporter [Planctomycetota bacterium]